MGNYWQGRKVLVTGAGGFIGSHVAELLVERGARVSAAVWPSPSGTNTANLDGIREHIRIVPADLTGLDDCMSVCQGQDVVINVAHVDGSTAFKQSHPAFIFKQNMLITLHMLEAACKRDAERFLVMSSAEVYAPDAAVPTAEPDGFLGLPSSVTDGYAWSKRMSEFAAQVFAREHGLNVAIARPSNVYGPRDHYDAHKGRVVSTFIRQVFDGAESISIWGSGEQVRTFLYVEDLARGLLDLVERHPACDPVNLGGTEPITIKGLAELIVRLSGRNVQIVCNPAGPSGPQTRTSDVTKAEQILNFTCRVPLEVGLRHTIEAFRTSHAVAAPL